MSCRRFRSVLTLTATLLAAGACAARRPVELQDAPRAYLNLRVWTRDGREIALRNAQVGTDSIRGALDGAHSAVARTDVVRMEQVDIAAARTLLGVSIAFGVLLAIALLMREEVSNGSGLP